MHATLLVALVLGGTTFEVTKDRHYGLLTLSYNGQPIMEDVGSANSPVVFFSDGKQAGGAPFHGNMDLVQAGVWVNSVGVPLQDKYKFTEPAWVHIQARSILYNAISVERQTSYGFDGLSESIVFTGFDAGKTITTFYASLGTRANRLTEWAAWDAMGLLLGSGSTAANNNAYTYLPKGTTKVAQYDPLAGNGLVTLWSESGNAFIWDRAYDNKLYLDIPSMDGPAIKHFELRQGMKFFEAPKASWVAKAALVPEPSGNKLAYVAIICCLAYALVQKR